MKVAVVYKSVHQGNTKIIAKEISDAINADLMELGGGRKIDIERYDLIGFGSGIYFGKHHKELLEFIDGLPTCKGKKAFIFSTSAFGKIPLILDFDRSIRKRLKKKGFVVLGSFSCRGYTKHSVFSLFGGIWKERPSVKDRERARLFAESILRITSDH